MSVANNHDLSATKLTHLPESILDAWQVAANHCAADQDRFAQLVAADLGLPVCDFNLAEDVVARFIPYKLAKEKNLVPIRLSGLDVVVAMADPQDENAIGQAKFSAGRAIQVEVAPPSLIEAHINHLYEGDVDSNLKSQIRMTEEGEPASDSDMQRHSIVKLARQLLFKAYTLKSSDIHVQPYMGGGQIRFRVDGVLRRSTSMPSNVMERLVRYFMNTTGMDPSQAMVPQDGRATMFVGNKRVDLRVSVLPSRDGQRLVIRLLDQSSVFSLASMNLPPQELKILRRLTSFSQGMILFTGPTGSGKTTSLYGLLASLNNEQTNIITLENPVEYQISGLSQVDINEARGLTFEAGLRSILRQDPDILLVGEIRDEQTAAIASRAALTGHLLFSTLHTMDARNAIARLLDLGISQPVLGETILGVVAQRLVRQLCAACSTAVVEPLSESENLFAQINSGRPPAKRAVGCEACAYTGYKGRSAVLEIIEMTPGLRHVLMNSAYTQERLNENLANSFQSLGQRARGLVQAGDTTVEEAHRVLGLKFWADIAEDENKDIYDLLSGDIGDGGVTRASLLMITEDADLLKRAENYCVDRYNLHAFGKISEALDYLKANRDVDLLVLDMETSDASPRQFLLDLRAAFDWSGLPALLILPEGDDSIQELLKSHGSNFVLTKPIVRGEVDAMVTAVFHR